MQKTAAMAKTFRGDADSEVCNVNNGEGSGEDAKDDYEDIRGGAYRTQ